MNESLDLDLLLATVGREYLEILLPHIAARAQPSPGEIDELDRCTVVLGEAGLLPAVTAPTDDPPSYTDIAEHLAQYEVLRDVDGVALLRADPGRTVTFTRCQERDLVVGAILAMHPGRARWTVAEADGGSVRLDPVDQLAAWFRPAEPMHVSRAWVLEHFAAVPGRYAALSPAEYYEQVIRPGVAGIHEPALRKVWLGTTG